MNYEEYLQEQKKKTPHPAPSARPSAPSATKKASPRHDTHASCSRSSHTNNTTAPSHGADNPTFRKPHEKTTDKPDTATNPSGLDLAIEQQKKREKQLYPLRVSPTTTLLLPKDKCNPEYAQKYYKEKINRI